MRLCRWRVCFRSSLECLPWWEVGATGSEGALAEGAVASFWSCDRTRSHLQSAQYVPSPVSALQMLTLFSHVSHVSWALKLSNFIPGRTEARTGYLNCLRLWQPLSGILGLRPGESHSEAGASVPCSARGEQWAPQLRHRDTASLAAGFLSLLHVKFTIWFLLFLTCLAFHRE